MGGRKQFVHQNKSELAQAKRRSVPSQESFQTQRVYCNVDRPPGGSSKVFMQLINNYVGITYMTVMASNSVSTSEQSKAKEN
ncbi:hypothetical protein M514_01658 [Trichuris suis]|uniref:Uncharacterized protein n=1 Tax=Trichuris suis TaxID=68888 RepID=A0A085N5U9_9BILA|nr:hypothetical protein M514_01658 [Trichuris suis]